MINAKMKGWLLLTLFSFCVCNALAANQWSGTDYLQNSSVQQSHAERLLQSLSLKGDEAILDMGCGDGRVAEKLAKRVPQGFVIGIDPSDSMLAKAEEIRQNSHLANLAFYKESAETFALDERFDHIVTIHVMHWIKEQEQALKNLYAHLKPGGQVHFLFAASKEGLPFYRALQQTLQAWKEQFVGFVNPQQVYDMETYRQLMVKAGFHVEAIHYIYHESIHENKEKLKNWIKQWQPHVRHLPPLQQSTFLDELINHYLNEMGLAIDTTDPIQWGEYVLIVEGKRIQ